MGISLSMNCPMCGGALSLDEGSKTTTCAYCGALLAIEGDDGINKLTYQNNLDKDKAISVGKRLDARRPEGKGPEEQGRDHRVLSDLCPVLEAPCEGGRMGMRIPRSTSR